MNWNPFLNALAALAYTYLVVLTTRIISIYRHDTPDTPLDSLGILSLFTLSAAVMAFLFFYQPLLYLLDGKKNAAVSYFFKTVGAFALVTIIILVLVTAQ